MQAFSLGKRHFGLIFSAYRAFQHLCEVEDQLARLYAVREHLPESRTDVQQSFEEEMPNQC